MNDNSTHTRALRRAQRNGDELRDELCWLGQRLATQHRKAVVFRDRLFVDVRDSYRDQLIGG